MHLITKCAQSIYGDYIKVALSAQWNLLFAEFHVHYIDRSVREYLRCLYFHLIRVEDRMSMTSLLSACPNVASLLAISLVKSMWGVRQCNSCPVRSCETPILDTKGRIRCVDSFLSWPDVYYICPQDSVTFPPQEYFFPECPACIFRSLSMSNSDCIPDCRPWRRYSCSCAEGRRMKRMTWWKEERAL